MKPATPPAAPTGPPVSDAIRKIDETARHMRAEKRAHIAAAETADAAEHRRRQGALEETEWRDPEDLNRLRRNPRKVAGLRTACAVRRLMRRQGKSGLLAPQHAAAADRFRLDFDAGRLGFTPDRDAARSGRSGPRQGPSDLELAQVEHQYGFERAKKAIGYRWGRMAEFVILENGNLNGWIDWNEVLTGTKVRPEVAMGLFVGLLDRLVEHYGLDEDKGTVPLDT